MSIHIEANINDIADTVLMPGDPLRAKWISDTFFEDAFCYNKVRGMLGYTGFYKANAYRFKEAVWAFPPQ